MQLPRRCCETHVESRGSLIVVLQLKLRGLIAQCYRGWAAMLHSKGVAAQARFLTILNTMLSELDFFLVCRQRLDAVEVPDSAKLLMQRFMKTLDATEQTL